VSRTLVAIELADLSVVPVPGDAISANGQSVGAVTSADRGYFVGRTIALGYVQPEAAVTGAQVTVTMSDGTIVPGTVNLKAAYDPEREIVRG
jgi:glycine cleavage system aminomethyltransferase T